ncbi:hypothetical protein BKA67DRAFT_664629 [Truncatella angustata]|uniref:Uncharacterized protein n=1 Tax=Truncatella angustata TaxID=152316 RepID=A0A9P8RK81_9PEZI|nr:uncharacterized protein BKA67DRAFT_664629 [Truncatella angustata]KAH6645571.1 hypothetical protein BKA67DRAFT_664629 [Truncatella angustata]
MIPVELIASAEDIFLRLLTECGSVEADRLINSLRQTYFGVGMQRTGDAPIHLVDGAVTARTDAGTDAGVYPAVPTDVTVAQLDADTSDPYIDPYTNSEAYTFTFTDHGATGEAVGEATGQPTREVVQEESYCSPGGLTEHPDPSSNHDDLPSLEEWLQDDFDLDNLLDDGLREEPLASHVKDLVSSPAPKVTLDTLVTDITDVTKDNLDNTTDSSNATFVTDVTREATPGGAHKIDDCNAFLGAAPKVSDGPSAGTASTTPSRKSTRTSHRNPPKPIIESRTRSTRSGRSAKTKCRTRTSHSVGARQVDRLLTLREHWECLRSIGLFHTAPREILRWDADAMQTQSMSDLFRGYDHVLDQVGKTDALQPWRRAVAQYRTLQ